MNYLLSFFFIVTVLTSKAQTQQDTVKLSAQDSAIFYSIDLNEIKILPNGGYSVTDDSKNFLILKRRVYKVYPYAKLTADKLTQLNATMAKLKTNKEKKKYFKIVEKYLTEEFEPRLKKFSRKDGQILVKLIHRQTGQSTFNLIKDYKSGWKAFWANSTARLFDINLRTEYKPNIIQEDFQIEYILLKAFEQRMLTKQDAFIPIDIEALKKIWKEKAEKQD